MIDPPEPDELGEDVDEFADEAAAAESPSNDDHDGRFFDAAPDAHALDDLTLDGRVGVLERLGPAHFRSKGFSFMGFLQTVYEHVAAESKGSATKAEPADSSRDGVM